MCRRTEYMGPNLVFCCSSAPRIPDRNYDRQTDGGIDGRTDRHNKWPLGLLVSNILKLSHMFSVFELQLPLLVIINCEECCNIVTNDI